MTKTLYMCITTEDIPSDSVTQNIGVSGKEVL